MKKDKLRLLHANINSINKNLDSLLSTISNYSCQYDMLCLTETKLSEISSNLFDIPNYKSFSVNQNSHGGGVRIYIRNDLGANLIPELTGIFPTHESLFLRVNISGKVLTIGVIYRPPSDSIAQFNAYI